MLESVYVNHVCWGSHRVQKSIKSPGRGIEMVWATMLMMGNELRATISFYQCTISPGPRNNIFLRSGYESRASPTRSWSSQSPCATDFQSQILPSFFFFPVRNPQWWSYFSTPHSTQLIELGCKYGCFTDSAVLMAEAMTIVSSPPLGWLQKCLLYVLEHWFCTEKQHLE